jgi:hypothetical protein
MKTLLNPEIPKWKFFMQSVLECKGQQGEGSVK